MSDSTEIKYVSGNNNWIHDLKLGIIVDLLVVPAQCWLAFLTSRKSAGGSFVGLPQVSNYYLGPYDRCKICTRGDIYVHRSESYCLADRGIGISQGSDALESIFPPFTTAQYLISCFQQASSRIRLTNLRRMEMVISIFFSSFH